MTDAKKPACAACGKPAATRLRKAPVCVGCFRLFGELETKIGYLESLR